MTPREAITSKNSLLGPQKVKNAPNLSQNQKLDLKETQKIKVVQLHNYTPTHFLKIPLSKNSQFRPQKSKTTPKINQNQMSKLKET